MSDPAISVRGLGKRYKIGARLKYKTLRDTLVGSLSAPARLFRPREPQPTFWALDDIDFDVPQGEVLGLIGGNGAGKSTLLKILSRITEPTRGRIEIRGRVGSLLEVGTGFHPELSGRENIFLNGAILGMRREEIRRKFDEIVAFAELEKFLDTPVKHYSSGMYTRLAFSVAAHLEPEILLVDEVLAVGDMAFQRKCMGKMGEVAGEGRTVILVSHNTSAIWSLCKNVIWLESGKIRMQGESSKVVQAYREAMCSTVDRSDSRQRRKGDGAMRFDAVHISDERGRNIGAASCGAHCAINVSYELRDGVDIDWSDLAINILVQSQSGERILPLCSWVYRDNHGRLPRQGVIRCELSRFPLAPGNYDLIVSSQTRGVLNDKLELPQFLVVTEGDFFGIGELPKSAFGSVYVDASWSLFSSDTQPEIVHADIQPGGGSHHEV